MSSILNLSFWSRPDANFNAHDLMQNPDQSCMDISEDPHGLDKICDPDDPAWFQPCSTLSTFCTTIVTVQ